MVGSQGIPRNRGGAPPHFPEYADISIWKLSECLRHIKEEHTPAPTWGGLARSLGYTGRKGGRGTVLRSLHPRVNDGMVANTALIRRLIDSDVLCDRCWEILRPSE